MTDPHDARAIDQLRRDVDTWRAIARCAIHALAAEYRETIELQRKLDAAYEELRRITRERVSA